MADEFDSLDPKTPGLDRQRGELEGGWTTTPEQMYEGLKELHGEEWLKEQGIEKPTPRGLKTGGLETGGLETGKLKTGKVGDKRKLGNSVTGGGGVAVVADDAAPNIRELVKAEVESLFLKAKPLTAFQVYRGTDEDDVKVYEGCILMPRGTQDSADVVTIKTVVDTSADITVTGTGSIWLQMDVTFVQLSHTTASSGITHDSYRAHSVSGLAYTFRAAAPSAGSDSNDVWDDEVRLYWEIAEVQLVDGVAGVTRQIQAGPIMVPNFTDSKIS